MTDWCCQVEIANAVPNLGSVLTANPCKRAPRELHSTNFLCMPLLVSQIRMTDQTPVDVVTSNFPSWPGSIRTSVTRVEAAADRTLLFTAKVGDLHFCPRLCARRTRCSSSDVDMEPRGISGKGKPCSCTTSANAFCQTTRRWDTLNKLLQVCRQVG
jgi:hypothetical protein